MRARSYQGEPNEPPSDYELWTCRKCGHEVLAKEKPQPIRWTDGHVCSFHPEPEDSDCSPAGPVS